MSFPVSELAPDRPTLPEAIVFVAPGVADSEIRPWRFGAPVEVVRVADGGDGLAEITRVLAGRSGLAALHVLGLRAGGAPEMAEWRSAAAWGAALRSDASIGLHGCGLGASAGGWALLGRLAALTGADVAACDEVTGDTLLGG